MKSRFIGTEKILKIYNLATGGPCGRSATLPFFVIKATPEASRAFEVRESGERAGGSIPRLRERHPGSSTVMFGALPRSLFLFRCERLWREPPLNPWGSLYIFKIKS